MCYQQKIKRMFGDDWKAHYNAEDAKNYVLGKTKKVEQIEISSGKVIKTYRSVAEVGRTFNRCPDLVSKVCRGERKTAYGYLWRYK